MTIIFILISMALFGSAQSASFECKFSVGEWSPFGKVYWCNVQNAVNITTLDEARVDSISGTHLAGFNNDNVEVFSVTIGQVHYFPRGLNKIFKNLKGIHIGHCGLREIHKSDLKDFPKLIQFWLYGNSLEILEENLFEFNPCLESIYLNSNKISQIDPNVFDKLTKLYFLSLQRNTCIDMYASNNSTAIQNVIKTANANCTNSEYSMLQQKVKNLEIESKNLNSENLKIEIENLENEIKDSKFPNFFQENLKDLKAVLLEKKKLEFLGAISSVFKNNIIEMCSALESKVGDGNDKLVVQDIKISRIEDKMTKISDSIELINKNYEDLNRNFSNLMKALENAFSAAQ